MHLQIPMLRGWGGQLAAEANGEEDLGDVGARRMQLLMGSSAEEGIEDGGVTRQFSNTTAAVGMVRQLVAMRLP